MTQRELLTLNRTLAVQVTDKLSGSIRVAKVNAFIGHFSSHVNRDEAVYTVEEIHLPDPVILDKPVRLQLRKNTIVSSQEIK